VRACGQQQLALQRLGAHRRLSMGSAMDDGGCSDGSAAKFVDSPRFAAISSQDMRPFELGAQTLASPEAASWWRCAWPLGPMSVAGRTGQDF
jgi:hypothetical protein